MQVLYAIYIRSLSLLLAVILLSGNILSCTGKTDSSAYANDTFVPLSDDSWTTIKDDSFSGEYITEFTVFPEDEFTDEYIAEFTAFLEDKFHVEIDDIFISYITLDMYDEMSFIVDYERKLDINRIVANLAIGGVIILVCVAIPALAPGLSPQVAALLLAVPQKALASAAISAAVSGVISYVQNDGDLTEALYDAVEGGSEGFKYGAIFAAGEAAFGAARLAVNAERIRRMSAANVQKVIEQSRHQISALPNSEREALKALTGNEYYERINLVKRTGRGSLSSIESQIDRYATNALSKASLADDVVVWRGISMSDDFEALIGHNIRDINNRVTIEGLSRLEGRSIIERGYFHTSLSKNVAPFFGDDLIMEIFIPKGSKAFHLGPGNSYHYGENEILMAAGQILNFGKARLENGLPIIEVFIGEAAAALPSAAIPAAAAALPSIAVPAATAAAILTENGEGE